MCSSIFLMVSENISWYFYLLLMADILAVMTEKLPHKAPKDLIDAINADKVASEVWTDITPLARNEWICWVISGKKAETRQVRISKTISKMRGGMRRPCCFAGCTHRQK